MNERWIRELFQMESKDEEMFADQRATIITHAGEILVAETAGECIGCCAPLPTADAEFEVVKMAVAPAFHDQGVGRALLAATIQEARRLQARSIHPETNQRLRAGVRLYESLEFRHLEPDEITPSPYKRTDVYLGLELQSE